MINNEMLLLGSNRSAIRELHEEGKRLKEKYGIDNVFDFSIGNPSAPAPKIVSETLLNLINLSDPTELHRYTAAEGNIKTRDAIAKYISTTYSTSADKDLIYLTSGSASSLSITIKALTDGNGLSEVMIFTPYFPEYEVYIKNANAKCVTVEPDFNTFYPNLEDFENKITINTSLVIINSPNNPTGVLYKENIIKDICNILYKKEKEFNHPIFLLSDEPYRELVFTDDKYPFITNYYDNSIVAYSFSKSASIPGERIGYILVNPKSKYAKDVFNAIHGAGRALGYICAGSLFQHLIPHCLGYTADINIYKTNTYLLYNELKKIGYESVKPDGAFYLFVKTLCDDDNEFSKKALEYNLMLVPSESFGIKGYVRIATCVTQKQIIDSIPKFKELYNYYKNNA